MPYQVPDRVHIMPVGFEEDRIFKTAEVLKADQVVLVVNRNDSEEERAHRDVAEAKLRELGYEPEIVDCDIFNLYESLGAIARVISRYEDEDVHVNVSTGSKVTAIAGMIAAMMSRANAYYVRAEEYKNEDVPRGIKDIFELPRYPIEKPDLQHILILKYLNENSHQKLTKSDLIDFSELQEFQFISNKDVSRKAKYRLLDNHIIEPLLNDGYITISEEGRNRIVDISDEGANLIEAFGFMIEESKSDRGQEFLSAF
jgi:hypothetical protein